jgi:carbamate kinase
MKIVAALGGNALLERGEAPESDIQEAHVVKAVQALAPLALEHDLVVTHGRIHGPQDRRRLPVRRANGKGSRDRPAPRRVRAAGRTCRNDGRSPVMNRKR